MTIRLNALSHAVGIALLLMLAPVVAGAQNMGAAAQRPEKTAQEPALLKSSPTATETSSTPERTGAYTIKQGDTLWDLSNVFFKDPFLWPLIWQENPSISNPDLIFAGSTLSIPSLAPIERSVMAEAAPAEQVAEKQVPTAAAEEPAKEEKPVPGQKPGQGAAGATLQNPEKPSQAAEGETRVAAGGIVVPQEQPVPIIDKYAMLSAGFVNLEETGDRIVGTEEQGRTTLSYDDVVYVDIHNREQVNVGDKFLIFEPQNKVLHPKTGKQYGRLIRGLGILQIVAKDTPDVLTARITLSFDSISLNSRLTPYQEPALIYNAAEKKAKDISGFVLEVADTRTINSTIDFLYLDKGSADGVEPGDRFVVNREPYDRRFPRKPIGELQVFLVKEHTSTAIVRKSTDAIYKGFAVDFKK